MNLSFPVEGTLTFTKYGRYIGGDRERNRSFTS